MSLNMYQVPRVRIHQVPRVLICGCHKATLQKEKIYVNIWDQSEFMTVGIVFPGGIFIFRLKIYGG